MSIPDPTIDPITGLPLVTSGPGIDSIPLGVQSFPWNDYKAETLPPRSPIAPDDLIPVHANVAGQTPDGNLHLIQSTTQQHLQVRESVFQNLGAKIPTGTTAPVDVNVVSGGGGGGTTTINPIIRSNSFADLSNSFTIVNLSDKLTSDNTVLWFSYQWMTSNTSQLYSKDGRILIEILPPSGASLLLGDSGAYGDFNATTIPLQRGGSMHQFNPGLKLSTYFGVGVPLYVILGGPVRPWSGTCTFGWV